MAEARFSSVREVRREFCPTCEHRAKYASCRPFSMMDKGEWACLMVAKPLEAEDGEEECNESDC